MKIIGSFIINLSSYCRVQKFLVSEIKCLTNRTANLVFRELVSHAPEYKIHDKNISPIFESLLSGYNEIIARDALIKTGFSDVENQRRYWEIEDFSKVPCGGYSCKINRGSWICYSEKGQYWRRERTN